MEIKTIRFSDIIPDDYNPRKQLSPADPAYQSLKRSLLAFGDVEPFVYNRRTKHIVGGHQRVQVLKDMGWTEAEASVIDVDERTEKLINMTLNKVKGRWDYDKLSALLTELSVDEEALSLTGFRPDELSVLLANTDDIEDPYDWIDNCEEEYTSNNEIAQTQRYIITLQFTNRKFAEQWLLGQDTSYIIRKHSSSLLIPM